MLVVDSLVRQDVLVRRMPRSLPQPVAELVRWLDSCEAPPLPAELVPGATEEEGGRLAVLGALARGLAAPALSSWPEELTTWARIYPSEIDERVLRSVTDALDRGGEDVLARTYEYVVSGKTRRRLGTFFTPAPIVEHMITASSQLAGTPANVIDPGAGVGAFTVASLVAWPGARVAAVDVNAATLGLLAARTTHSDIVGRARGRVDLIPRDYLSWLPDGFLALGGPRLILGNPPYTRHQLMTAKDKNAARQASGLLITSGLAGLSTYFLAGSLNVLAPQDALCMLLPGSWCETRYGREIRAWLWTATHRRVELHLFPSTVRIFPGTQVTAMVLLVGPERSRDQHFVVHRAELREGSHERVLVTRTVEPDRTGSYPHTFTSLFRRPHRLRRRSVTLASVVIVRRGVATGANKYFFLTEEMRREHRLPDAALRRALVRPGHCDADVLTRDRHDALRAAAVPCWLLDLNGSRLAETDPDVVAYLAFMRSHRAHSSYLARHRPLWHTVESVSAPDLFLAPVGGPSHRVIVNTVGAVGSNNFYGLSVRPDAPWTPGALASWFRAEEGQRLLADIGRQYQGGSRKIEPRALQELQVPATLVDGSAFRERDDHC